MDLPKKHHEPAGCLRIFLLASALVLPATAQLNPHPRLLFTAQKIAELKTIAGDPANPNYGAVEALRRQATTLCPAADAMPYLRLIDISNASPAIATVDTDLPRWDGVASLYLGGGSGNWSALNPPSHGYERGAIRIDNRHFALYRDSGGRTAFDTTGLGSYQGQSMRGMFRSKSFFDYEGFGWKSCVQAWTVAHHAASADGAATSYSGQLVAFIDYVNDLTVHQVEGPWTVDNGYAIRSGLWAFGLAVDSAYPYLSDAQKAAAADTVNYAASFHAPPAGASDIFSSNFPMGYIYGTLAATLATCEENLSCGDLYNTWSAAWDKATAYAFSSEVDVNRCENNRQLYCGTMRGGLTPESYFYGVGATIDIVELIQMIRNAGLRDDIRAGWMNLLVRHFMYAIKPNRWQVVFEADTPAADWFNTIPSDALVSLSDLLEGQQEGGWAQKLVNDAMANWPTGTSPFSSFARVMHYRADRPAVDYTQTEPVARAFLSDNHYYWRSDWSADATWAMFHGSQQYATSHQGLHNGHIDIQRGNDWLLPTTYQFNGLSAKPGAKFIPGVTGQGRRALEIYGAGQGANTLCFNDSTPSLSGGAYSWTPCGQSDWQGYGSMITNTSGGAQWSYAFMDMTANYDERRDRRSADGSGRYLRYYLRSFVPAGDGSFVVWDQVRVAHSTAMRKLLWHFNPVGPPVVQGNEISSTVNSSKVYLTFFSNEPVAIATMPEPANWGPGTTYRAELTPDPQALDMSVLTVIYATSSNGAKAPATSIKTDANSVGALIQDGMAKVVVFSNRVITNPDYRNPQSSPRPQSQYINEAAIERDYTAEFSGPGRHMVANLAPGNYTVLQNGFVIWTNQPVASDGVLAFTSTGGGAFTVRLM